MFLDLSDSAIRAIRYGQTDERTDITKLTAAFRNILRKRLRKQIPNSGSSATSPAVF